jgi:plasmid replication initiation protein
MQKEIITTVAVGNALTEVAFKNFGASEMNIFMTVLAKMKNQGTRDVFMDFNELRKLCNYTGKDKKRFIETIKTIKKKTESLEIEKDGLLISFYFFSIFALDEEKGNVAVRVNNDFTWLINELTSNFTRFELEEFTSLKSTYSKNCYFRLKRYKDTGWWSVSLEDFRKLLNIPAEYSTSNIKQRILTPIEKELSPLFENFEIRKVYKKDGYHDLEGFIFVFGKDKTENKKGSEKTIDIRHKYKAIDTLLNEREKET